MIKYNKKMLCFKYQCFCCGSVVSAEFEAEGLMVRGVVGGLLSRSRVCLELSQGELGKKIGVSQAAYSRIERGTGELSLNRFFRICDILGIDSGSVLDVARNALAVLEVES